MDPLLAGILSIALLLVLLLLGVHIGLSLGVTGVVGTMLISGVNQAGTLAVATVFYVLSKPVLSVVPLFVFMGVLSGVGGISRDIYTVLGMWVGRFKGVLGVATVLSTTAFGVVTGSSMVTAAVFSKMSAPEMRRQGFDKRLAYGLCAASGAIGMLIPPSILIVVYSILSQVSTGQLLMAGIVPGVFLAGVFCITVIIIGQVKPALVGSANFGLERVTWRQRLTSLKLLWPVFVCAGIMTFGILGGVFSPEEAAAWGALVLIIVTIFTGGSERWRIVGRGLLETISISAMVFLIIGGAALYARFLILSGVTPAVLKYVIGAGLSQVGFAVAMAAVYLLLGCFLESVSMLSITLPVVIPVANAMGINPIYFGMVQILSIEIGLITPPVGMNVFAAKAVAEPDVTVEDIFRGSIPFLAAMVVLLAAMIAFPWISTVLPSLMFK